MLFGKENLNFPPNVFKKQIICFLQIQTVRGKIHILLFQKDCKNCSVFVCMSVRFLHKAFSIPSRSIIGVNYIRQFSLPRSKFHISSRKSTKYQISCHPRSYCNAQPVPNSNLVPKEVKENEEIPDQVKKSPTNSASDLLTFLLPLKRRTKKSIPNKQKI